MKHLKLKLLIEMLKQGKSEYFDEFYSLTKVSVFYTIKKVINNNDTIQDLMQDSYVTFLNNLHKIDKDNNPLSYLLTIARNKAIDYYRKNSKTDNIDFMENLDLMPDNKLEILDNPLLVYSKKNLSEEEFKILELTIVMGYKRVEVAKMLNEPVSTLNWKYNQILKKIKNFYKEVYHESK